MNACSPIVHLYVNGFAGFITSKSLHHAECLFQLPTKFSVVMEPKRGREHIILLCSVALKGAEVVQSV
jgi:hypothetical protein